MKPVAIAQRVNDPQHGDGTVYSVRGGYAFVMFDDGSEDRAYPLTSVDSMLGCVTERLPLDSASDLYTLVATVAACDLNCNCDGCSALVACRAARAIPAWERKQVALALIGATTC